MSTQSSFFSDAGPSNMMARTRFTAAFRVQKTCRRPVVTTRRHIFTADVTQDMIEHTNPLVLLAATLNFLFG
ncbi:hypothetical protein JHK87_012554 [Glycine soja]|nr:hypothetical protein JHK87_012554 [Glycine soja]